MKVMFVVGGSPTRRKLFQSLIFSCALCFPVFGAEVPEKLRPWLGPQTWKRDANGPIVSLGEPGEFDDAHIFAPAVVREKGRFWLWYCGSRGKVEERVFQLGLATGVNGRDFVRHPSSPVFAFGDGQHSILTPALLRTSDGTPLREDGKMRMWFSSTWFGGENGLHTLHETTSEDGLHWEKPSKPLLSNAYAPTVLKTDNGYEMWYVDVSETPRWVIGHAKSFDGRKWIVTTDPVLEVDQNWEHTRLNYPTVLRVRGGPPGEFAKRQEGSADSVYLMWYGSRTSPGPRTAIGFAVSLDGITWYKHPDNPVLRPDPSRPWESHYTTSQSAIRYPDGSFRMWYASRTKPPHVNKYFAINTVVWRRVDHRPTGTSDGLDIDPESINKQ